MGLSEEIRRQLISSFKSEQSEHVQKMNQGLLELEKDPASNERQALLADIFREAHSLKGAARAVGMTMIESLGHGMEDLLSRVQDGRLDFSTELFDLLYQALDAVELLVERTEAGNSTPPAKVLALLAQLEEAASKPAPVPMNGHTKVRSSDFVLTETEQVPAQSEILESGPGPGPDVKTEQTPRPHQEQPPTPQSSVTQDETIRISVSKLDSLMAQFSELVGAKIRAEQRLDELRDLQAFAGNWQKEWTGLRANYHRLVRNGHDGHNKDITALVDFAGQNQEQIRTFNAQTNTLYRQFSNDNMRLALIIDDLQEEIKRARMLPLTTVTATFGRMIRDLAHEYEKKITLTIAGDDTELDKRILEHIKAPLIHLLRNAVDHGLETPTEREQAGKPAAAEIILSASQLGNTVVIKVSDDGRGLDIPSIRMAAVRKGLLSQAEANRLSQAEAIGLIFNSGLSTNQIITDISGRGVGLDVVRQNVEELQGTLDVSSKSGQGTTFTMTLPLTLASSRGLLVRVGEQTFALPLSMVNRMLQIDPSKVATVEGKPAMTYQGKPVALAWLADLLELPRNIEDDEQLTVVIIGVAEKQLGLIVDDLVGEQEIVTKTLGKQLARVSGIAGATVLGSGQVILVLHSADLLKLAARTTPRLSPRETKTHRNGKGQPKKILVVDDSITTRTLEKNILEVAGYNVKLATNGEEALGMLASDGVPNLIVSDVNMPRLDGFDLTQRIKQDDRYANIPIILVTSLDSPADKARGIDVGADAYLVKSSFDQGNLLNTIEQLL